LVLPRSRVVVHGANDVADATYTFAALGHDPRPFEPGDLFRYYTVEFRHKSRWDAGIPGDIILVHEVRRRNGNGDMTQQQFAFLQRDLSRPGRDPGCVKTQESKRDEECLFSIRFPS